MHTALRHFFSSGFAYPGFTVLGPRVVGMAPRSLRPGFLDHELVHNWWGNGVYVDPDDGNWCEALTSFCANAFVSSSFKFAQGFIDLNVALPICIGALLGSNVGATLNRRLPSNTIKLIFGLVFSFVSLKFVFLFFQVQP